MFVVLDPVLYTSVNLIDEVGVTDISPISRSSNINGTITTLNGSVPKVIASPYLWMVSKKEYHDGKYTDK